MSNVTIVEVAPRDGFQAVKTFIPTEKKIEVIEALGACGFQRMEIGSFVNPKALPQMADLPEIMKRVKLAKSMRLQVLVPNRKGYEAALLAGFTEICWVQSVSESHNQSNVRRSTEQSFRDFEDAWRDLGKKTPFLRFNLATAFDCPFEGKTPEDRVIRGVERALEIVDTMEIGIADTTGRAAPNHVRSLLEKLVTRYQSAKIQFGFHGHDTYNLGVSNAVAAYQAGVTVIDGAAAGLGGCPFAPGASGNTASEDLVFAFEHMGVKTGIDFPKLLAAADLAQTVAPEQACGRLRGVTRKRALAGFGAETKGFAG